MAGCSSRKSHGLVKLFSQIYARGPAGKMLICSEQIFDRTLHTYCTLLSTFVSMASSKAGNRMDAECVPVSQHIYFQVYKELLVRDYRRDLNYWTPAAVSPHQVFEQ